MLFRDNRGFFLKWHIDHVNCQNLISCSPFNLENLVFYQGTLSHLLLIIVIVFKSSSLGFFHTSVVFAHTHKVLCWGKVLEFEAPHLWKSCQPFNSNEWPEQNFSLLYLHNIIQTSDENNEKYHHGITNWSNTKFSKITEWESFGRQ